MRRAVSSRAGIGALLIVGLVFLGVGYLGFVAPNAILDPVEIRWSELQERRAAKNELTAVYGGMHVAMGIYFIVAAFTASIRAGALLAAAAFMSGLVAGRIVSLVRDGLPGPMPLALILVELMGVLLTLGALLKRRAPAPVPAEPVAVTPAAPSQPVQP
jgi:hypothetical protein